MYGAWGYAVQILLPVPLVFLTLLSLPTPKALKQFIMDVCRNVLNIRAFGILTLFQFMMLVATMAFINQCWRTYETSQKYHDLTQRADLSPGEKLQQLADKWRHERNFWISAFCCSLWLILQGTYRMNAQYLAAQEELMQLKGESRGENPPPPADDAGKRPKGSLVKDKKRA